jgi:hypothetical protein
MKKNRFWRILGVLVILVILVIAGYVGYIALFLPNVKVKDIRVEATPERIEHGKYLVNHVMVCLDCHSTRNWTTFAGQVKPGTEGGGGEIFGHELGFPGTFIAPNITPFALKDWTDGELYRALTAGVNKQGKALFPLMPYMHYGNMDTEDIYSVMAYIRTLAPLETHPASSKADFPLSLILHTIPKYGVPQTRPPKAATVEYGKYLVNAADCIECHSPDEKGQLIPGKEFSGGRQFPVPGGTVYTANITPDVKTGIGSWSDSAFLAKFRNSTAEKMSAPVDTMGFISIMPWTMFAGMDTTDILAIHAYLKTLPAVENQVQKFVPKQQ